MTQRDPDMIRVSKRQLMRIFGRSLAKPLLEQHVRELEAAPENEVLDGPIPEESRMLAAQVFGQKERRRA